jgi:hypothetical protein
MCAVGDLAEVVVKHAPFQTAVADGGLLVSEFANEEHAAEFVQALEKLCEHCKKEPG